LRSDAIAPSNQITAVATSSNALTQTMRRPSLMTSRCMYLHVTRQQEQPTPPNIGLGLLLRIPNISIFGVGPSCLYMHQKRMRTFSVCA